MTYREFLAQHAADLPNSDTPFLDACLLLSHSLQISRDALMSRFPERMGEVPALFSDYCARRRAGESVAYIMGKKEFFGREFRVDSRVLVPRPDTEILVQAALETGDALQAHRAPQGHRTAQSSGEAIRLHDACTGSGAIAVSIAAERTEWEVSASDISAAALEIARTNSRLLSADRIRFVAADLLDGLEGPFDIIAANPPYVPSEETDGLLAQGWGEPRLALDGGPDGLDLIPRLIRQAITRLSSGGFLLIETDSLQVPKVCDMFQHAGYCGIRVWKDFSGLERVTGGYKP